MSMVSCSTGSAMYLDSPCGVLVESRFPQLGGFAVSAQRDDSSEGSQPGAVLGKPAQPSAELGAPAVRGRHVARSPRSARGWLIAAVAFVVAIGGLSLWVGPSAMIGPWDVFTLLNGAYRIHEGQSPSTDFSNPIGPLVYGLVAIGMHLSLSLRAVTYSQVIFLVIGATLAGLVVSAAARPVCGRVHDLCGLAFGICPAAGLLTPIDDVRDAIQHRCLGALRHVAAARAAEEARHPARAARSADRRNAAWPRPRPALLRQDHLLHGRARRGGGWPRARHTAPQPATRGVRPGRVRHRQHPGAVRLPPGHRGLRSRPDHSGRSTAVRPKDRATGDGHQWSSPNGFIAVLVAALLVFTTHRYHKQWRPLVLLLLAAAYVMASSILLSAGDAAEGSDLPALVVIPLITIAFLEPQLPRWAGGSATTRPLSWSRREYSLLLAAWPYC